MGDTARLGIYGHRHGRPGCRTHIRWSYGCPPGSGPTRRWLPRAPQDAQDAQDAVPAHGGAPGGHPGATVTSGAASGKDWDALAAVPVHGGCRVQHAAFIARRLAGSRVDDLAGLGCLSGQVTIRAYVAPVICKPSTPAPGCTGFSPWLLVAVRAARGLLRVFVLCSPWVRSGFAVAARCFVVFPGPQVAARGFVVFQGCKWLPVASCHSSPW